jgi:hypothetical protein
MDDAIFGYSHDEVRAMERIPRLQAALSVKSMSGHGTCLEVRAPLPGS